MTAIATVLTNEAVHPRPPMLKAHQEYYVWAGSGGRVHTAAPSLQTFKFHYPPGITNHGLKNDLTEHAKGQFGAENDAKTGHL